MTRFKLTYHYLKRNGRCAKCQKKDAYTLAGHALCYECLQKLNQWSRRYYSQNSQKINQIRRERVNKRIEDHMCARCGKPFLPQDNHKNCPSCRAYARKKQTQYNRKKGIIETRFFPDGFCSRCGKHPRIEGKKLCKRCYDVTIQNVSKTWGKQPDSHPWSLDELARKRKNKQTLSQEFTYVPTIT